MAETPLAIAMVYVISQGALWPWEDDSRWLAMSVFCQFILISISGTSISEMGLFSFSFPFSLAGGVSCFGGPHILEKRGFHLVYQQTCFHVQCLGVFHGPQFPMGIGYNIGNENPCRNQCLCFRCLPVSSCITTYKKTPPPVPPRTTTKPFISITAQSSTESAQDAYMDGQGQRGDIISQSGLSNSTESLDSMKALTAAIEAANAQIHGPASQHMGNNAATTSAAVTAEDRKKDHFKKNRCLSVGIQVTASPSVL